ncbi:DUF1501 domain-containing protein [Emticicia fluvialis]|uniref:DUF1501 domain-containing protein n=1 Tax=Emticicia fluvialis TaxID=2974474 RepID=UPI0021660755|nr:DUF1501 domain-containing protein [Emticicia fluvialis]
MASRRDFIKQSALATIGGMLVPHFLKAYETQHLGVEPVNGKVLVVVQLSGGNDGLNTVIPYTNDIYYKARPNIGIAPDKVLKLNNELGLNPAMDGLRRLYDDGLVSIINNVGYPNPDRSHFRSMDIWHTASESTEYLNTGWLGRYLDANCAGHCTPYQALEIDDTLSLSMKGENVKALAVKDTEKLYRQVSRPFISKVAGVAPVSVNQNLSYMYKTLAETSSSAEFLHTQSKIYKSSATYPVGELGQRLKTIAELIISDLPTRVYYVSVSGFDTHFNQLNQQERLLQNYSSAIQVFVNDLQKNNKINDVVIMTFSEFGRRVKENASAGTDHGTANNLFLIGGSLKRPEILNEAPDLTNLDEGDLKFSVDFRDIYESLLNDWLHSDAKKILGRVSGNLKLV